MVHCDASTDFLVDPFIHTISYVDRDTAGKRVGEHNTQLFSWLWPGNDESILAIVTSTIDTTMLSIVNAVMAGLPHTSRKI